MDPSLVDRFHQQFDDLTAVAAESNLRVIAETPDPLFSKYVNVFTKSYLVSACSILEAFIQDLAYSYLLVIQARVEASNLPRNLVLWQAVDLEKSKDLRFEAFKIKTAKKDLSDIISGNYYKTISAFQKIGVRLDDNKDFTSFKDYISSIIDKRNKIVHHNDDASDLSLADVIETIQTFKIYSDVLFGAVCADPHLKPSAAVDPTSVLTSVG